MDNLEEPNQVTSTNKKYSCTECTRSFLIKSSLNRHLRSYHQQKIASGHCVVCDEDYFNSYHQHLETKHDLKVEFENREFATEKEFYEWKHQIEKESRSSFTTKNSLPKGKIYYCHRRGDPKKLTESKRQRAGSYKSTLACPAMLSVRLCPNGRLKAHWVKTHFGHSNELQHLLIPHFDRQRIIQLLELGLSPIQVVKSLTSVEEKTERVHLITVQEVINIKKCHERRKGHPELPKILPEMEQSTKLKPKVINPPEIQMNSITLQSKQLVGNSNVVFLVPQLIHFSSLKNPVEVNPFTDFTEDNKSTQFTATPKSLPKEKPKIKDNSANCTKDVEMKTPIEDNSPQKVPHEINLEIEQKRVSSLEELKKLSKLYKGYLTTIDKAITLINTSKSETEMDNVVQTTQLYFPDLTKWHQQKSRENTTL